MTDEEILEIATQCGVWVPMGSNAEASHEQLSLIAMARKIESITAENYKNEIKHWKSNHSDMVARCSILRARHDLPAERTVAYRKLVSLQEENVELKKKLDIT